MPINNNYNYTGMTQIVTGYKRSLKIVVNKTIDGILAAGYPKYYPTALDVLNGYFTLNGINYSIPSQEQLGLMEQSEYDVLLLRFKQYVSLHEPDLSFSSDFVNSPEVYAPDECYQITTTTTEHETTTTTEHETTTTTEHETTTTTEHETEICGYGLLYNSYVVRNASSILRSGWHIPSEAEALAMVNYLGGINVAGGPLKSTGIDYFDSPNTGATNAAKFNMRGASIRQGTGGDFLLFKQWATIYLSNYVTADLQRYFRSEYNTDNIVFSNADAEAGLSIRGIKDSTTISHGETGTYVGNDGTVYQTICIGTQEWLSENLRETRYRNGDIIPEVTDNTEWASLTTGALCAYDNDWSNACMEKPDYY
jgi:uncharacterized protein (TIGR02145 family)